MVIIVPFLSHMLVIISNAVRHMLDSLEACLLETLLTQDIRHSHGGQSQATAHACKDTATTAQHCMSQSNEVLAECICGCKVKDSIACLMRLAECVYGWGLQGCRAWWGGCCGTCAACAACGATTAGSTLCWRRPRTSACTCSPSCSCASRASSSGAWSSSARYGHPLGFQGST